MSKSRAIVFFASLVAVVCASVNPAGNVQENECSVRVLPRIEDGHAYYEVATQLRENQQARFSWWRIEPAKPQQQNPLAEVEESSPIPDCPVSGNASGSTQGQLSHAHVGKNPDGSFCQVPAGQWAVRAEAGDCVADAKFTVPVKIRAGAIVGLWGGRDIGLRATSTITTIDFFCARGVINQPLLPDSNGDFDLQGTYARAKLGGALADLPARYVGRIDGKAMTLKVTVDKITQSYTLTLGQTPPPLPACR
jgi:hypothetical protein